MANGSLGEPIKGKEYARLAMLNLPENQNVFLSTKSERDFHDHMTTLDYNEDQIISDADPDSPDSFFKKMREKKKTVRQEPARDRRSLTNCFRFMFAKRLTQDEMVQEDMQIDIKHLLDLDYSWHLSITSTLHGGCLRLQSRS